jgi:hypothetical protein
VDKPAAADEPGTPKTGIIKESRRKNYLL